MWLQGKDALIVFDILIAFYACMCYEAYNSPSYTLKRLEKNSWNIFSIVNERKKMF